VKTYHLQLWHASGTRRLPPLALPLLRPGRAKPLPRKIWIPLLGPSAAGVTGSERNKWRGLARAALWRIAPLAPQAEPVALRPPVAYRHASAPLNRRAKRGRLAALAALLFPKPPKENDDDLFFVFLSCMFLLFRNPFFQSKSYLYHGWFSEIKATFVMVPVASWLPIPFPWLPNTFSMVTGYLCHGCPHTFSMVV
jgi:hypothetical protein